MRAWTCRSESNTVLLRCTSYWRSRGSADPESLPSIIMAINSDEVHIRPPASSSQNPSEPISSPSFRRATTADAAQISSLISRTWSHFFGHTIPPADLEIYLTTTLAVPQITEDIAHPDSRFLVASIPSTPPSPAVIERETIIGVAQLVFGTTKPFLTRPSPIELRRIYLDASHHASGLSTRLLDGIEEVARGEGGRASG